MTSNNLTIDTGISWSQFATEILPDPTYNNIFTKHDFVDESFAVDHFVDRHKDQPLEELRELLSSYLKKLRVACLDLMNEDYSDFVHLSSTLFDLRKSIEQVHDPLTRAHEEIKLVRSQIEESCNTLREKINLLNDVRRKISFIRSLAEVSSVISRIEERMKQYDSLDRLEKRLLIEESLDLLTSAERLMKRNEMESATIQVLREKIINLLKMVKSYKNSNEYLTCPFEFLLQKRYE